MSLHLLDNRTSSHRNSGISMIEDMETRYKTQINNRPQCSSSFQRYKDLLEASQRHEQADQANFSGIMKNR